jgi:putative transcriptional regulator
MHEQAHARRGGALLMENRLRILRAERSWSQQDLAERLEVSRQSVNAIETGKYDPSLPLAFRIAELFDRPIEDIFVSPSRRSSRAI